MLDVITYLVFVAIALATLILLVTLHELGHFLFARKFGVKVEEFGICLPPRIWGIKRGETIYSINWIPAGAFVKLYGEDSNENKDSRSFASKPVWQRAIIIAAGVISFWIVAAITYSLIYMFGAIIPVEDADNVKGAQVLIIDVAKDSPAQAAGIETEDIIKSMTLKSAPDQTVNVDKVSDVQKFAGERKGKELAVVVQRGGQDVNLSLTPRENPPAGQGTIGVALVRIAQGEPMVWYNAIGEGFATTWRMTLAVFEGWKTIIDSLTGKQQLPAGAQFVGPIGIVEQIVKEIKMGPVFYLRFMAMISVYLAVFNALPIPALDGGRLMFLAIEAVRRKPVPEKIEQTLTGFFFAMLLVLAVVVTVQDVYRIVARLF
ncbi:MAG: site-2 protease family protein [Candidatus Pacebacteria bacterium]|jgi:regulator of sigma E protease|nr:site-2 protease family protein [Candidatus Paceibacterota bacterium]